MVIVYVDHPYESCEPSDLMGLRWGLCPGGSGINHRFLRSLDSVLPHKFIQNENVNSYHLPISTPYDFYSHGG